VTDAAPQPEPASSPSPPPGMATRVCQKCSAEKPLTAFNARQRTCVDCVQAAKARTLERKDAVAWSPELGERIADMLAAGMTIAEICQSAGFPTSRQLRSWRRVNPDFDAACNLAETQSAAAHLDKAKEVLRNVEAGKLPASDGRLLFDGHIKLAATLNPSRYGSHATVDVTSAGRPLVDFGAAVQALIDALPAPSALPAPAPIDAEATPVPEERVLQ
jgi:transposase-like protein